MAHTPEHTEFKAINIAILTVSDTRTEETDSSGKILVERLTQHGHMLAEKVILVDDRYQLRAQVSQWIADDEVQAVIITGGTGMTGRDITPEAMMPLFDKNIDGFGEIFRFLSLDDIGTSTVQSRAVAGVANGTLIFCIPGSSGACKLAWDGILQQQLDSRTTPCNFINLIPRLKER
ncbi:MAG: molybdenum cofactor biosynthesis protein B [Gammaproteobacteria bacterium]|nr:molybdenum cofactor biosynthesis protein B [Gammaproteobacteria bacterium]MCF6230244.1 molybdenum cofactor biosynthesis protein B [Gammaproteobacteria bacterium]